MKIIAYLKPTCGWSMGVRAIMKKYDLEFEDRDIINNADQYAEMVEKSGQPLSPCVEIDGAMLADVSGDEVESYMLSKTLVTANETAARGTYECSLHRRGARGNALEDHPLLLSEALRKRLLLSPPLLVKPGHPKDLACLIATYLAQHLLEPDGVQPSGMSFSHRQTSRQLLLCCVLFDSASKKQKSSLRFARNRTDHTFANFEYRYGKHSHPTQGTGPLRPSTRTRKLWNRPNRRHERPQIPRHREGRA